MKTSKTDNLEERTNAVIKLQKFYKQTHAKMDVIRYRNDLLVQSMSDITDHRSLMPGFIYLQHYPPSYNDGARPGWVYGHTYFVDGTTKIKYELNANSKSEKITIGRSKKETADKFAHQAKRWRMRVLKPEFTTFFKLAEESVAKSFNSDYSIFHNCHTYARKVLEQCNKAYLNHLQKEFNELQEALILTTSIVTEGAEHLIDNARILRLLTRQQTLQELLEFYKNTYKTLAPQSITAVSFIESYENQQRELNSLIQETIEQKYKDLCEQMKSKDNTFAKIGSYMIEQINILKNYPSLLDINLLKHINEITEIVSSVIIQPELEHAQSYRLIKKQIEIAKLYLNAQFNMEKPISESLNTIKQLSIFTTNTRYGRAIISEAIMQTIKLTDNPCLDNINYYQSLHSQVNKISLMAEIGTGITSLCYSFFYTRPIEKEPQYFMAKLLNATRPNAPKLAL